MKKLICFFLLPVITISYLQAQPSKFISVKGKEIIGTDGKPFLMKGTNLGNWLVPEGYMFKFKHATSPRLIDQTLTELIGPDEVKIFWKKYLDSYITAADIHYLKTIGMNSLRVPFDYRLFTDEDYMGGRGEARGFQLLDKVISWCKKEGLYVLLDMHCAPGGQTGDNIDNSWGYPFLFDNAASRQLTIDTWGKIAKRYKNETTVLGYDLLNEPIAHYFDVTHFNPLLEPLYKQITKAIRVSDPNHLIFLGGAQWNSNFKIFGEPFDKKLVYTFHKYWTATTVDVVQDYLNFRDKYNVPIYCGETGENKDEWVMNFRVLLEQHNIGWHFWPYKKMENKAGIVEFKMPEHYKEIIQYADTIKRNFEAIRKLRPASVTNIKQALNDFLINCTYSNCTPNDGYIKALGLGKN
ncbi:MAG TPA: cellulase family glycosylhydrolase [Chitinophagaceae bacterium]